MSPSPIGGSGRHKRAPSPVSDAGATTLAVACPFRLVMLTAASTAAGVEAPVRDAAALVTSALVTRVIRSRVRDAMSVRAQMLLGGGWPDDPAHVPDPLAARRLDGREPDLGRHASLAPCHLRHRED